jgi:hypothetical protein
VLSFPFFTPLLTDGFGLPVEVGFALGCDGKGWDAAVGSAG